MSGSDRPAFTTARLRAEPVTRLHAAAMVEVLADRQIHLFLDGEPPDLAFLHRQYTFLEGGLSPDGSEHWLTWILFLHDDPTPIGFVQATVHEPEQVDVAYVLNPIHWRQGHATEAVTAMLDVVFATYRVERAIAEMDSANVASIALAESLGFRYVTTTTDPGDGTEEHRYELAHADHVVME